MKIFCRTSLPREIKYNKALYKYDATLSSLIGQGKAGELELPSARGKYILVKVLSRRLRGMTDLHHRLYQPTQHVFVRT